MLEIQKKNAVAGNENRKLGKHSTSPAARVGRGTELTFQVEDSQSTGK